MGFEVQYQFYEKLEDSFDYNREESKTFKKVYGKATDEYPLDKLAQSIMQQMARRDIFIYDLEIYEFQKKKISFRQNKSDLVIKNKKFSNTGVFLENIEVDENTNCQANHSCNQLIPINESSMPTVNIAPKLNLANNKMNLAQPISDRVIKRVQFLPGRITKPVGRFTVEKIYPVYRESLSENGVGMMIEVMDDAGKRVKVSDEHFVSVGQSLIGDNEVDFNGGSDKFASDSKLNWGGAIRDDVPKIR